MVDLIEALSLEKLIEQGPPPCFTQTIDGWKDVLSDWFESHPDGPGRKLYPGQVEALQIDLLSYAFALLGQEAQMAVQQRWLAFAEGNHLDLMAANNSTFRLEGESDEALRRRAAEAHDRISKAGPRASYVQQTKAFSAEIIDVAVIRPEPGHIHIYPLLNSGQPLDDFRQDLLAWLDHETKRPQGDDLTILAPEEVRFSVRARVRVRGDLEKIKGEVEASMRLAAMVWGRALGSYLASAVLTCAAKYVDQVIDIDEITFLDTPFKQLKAHQFAHLENLDLVMEAAQ